MRIVLVANPRSGRARNSALIRRLHEGMAEAGFHVNPVPMTAGADLSSVLVGADALVVAGGDGSVHHALDAAAGAGVPLYPFPLGTENLFAKACGVTRSVDRLIAMLRTRRTGEVDLATCNQRPFVLMCSAGFDAQVVNRVAAARGNGGVTRLHYVVQMLHEIRRSHFPRLRIVVDGATLSEGEPGLVIIANSPRYAAGLNPCLQARWDDGLVDVLFLPCDSRTAMLGWLVTVAARRHMRHSAARFARGRVVSVRCDQAGTPYQLDGEAVQTHGSLSLLIGVGHRRLRVPRP